MAMRYSRLAALALAVHAGFAHGLGVGQLELQSSLNQPLKAQIELFGLNGLNRNQVIARLGNNEAFARAGVERSFFLTEIDFNVEIVDEQLGRIVLTTQEPILEPYLDLVVDVRWPDGRIVREYTALVDLFDLPALVQETPAPQNPTQKTAPDMRITTREQVSSERPDSSPRALPPPGTIRSQVGDTLSKIARSVRPSEDTSLNQVMLALQRLNPEAFVDGNINRLKAGYNLKVPSIDDINALNPRSARRAVQEQMEDWTNGESSVTDASSSDPDSFVRLARGTADELLDAGDVSGGDNDPAGALGGSKTSGDDTQLALTLESLDQAQRQNQELMQRLTALEEQMATMQRMLQLKDAELARMQAQVGTQPVPGAAQQTDAAELPATESQAAPVVGQSAGLFGLSWSVLAGLIGVVLALIGGLLWVRKRQQENNDGELLASIEVVSESIQETEKVEETSAASTDQEVQQDTGAETNSAEAVAPPRPAASVEDNLNEVDIYIAYGRFDKALAILNELISAKPNLSDAISKRMEVSLLADDRDAFELDYHKLQSIDSDAAVSIFEYLKREHSSAATWLAALETTDFGASDELADGAEQNLDWDLSEESSQDRQTSTAAPLADESVTHDASDDIDLDAELDLDFDSELDFSELDTAGQELALEQDVELDLSDEELELELELDELELDEADRSDAFELDLEDLEGPSDRDRVAAQADVKSSLDEPELSFDEPLEGSMEMQDEDVRSDESTVNEAADRFDTEQDSMTVDLDLDFDDLDMSELADDNDLDSELAETSEDESVLDDIELDLDLGELGDVDDADTTTSKGNSSALLESLEEINEALNLDDSSHDELSMFDDDDIDAKLDLVRAFIDMDDHDAARGMLSELEGEGTDEQQALAAQLQKELDKA